MTTWLARFVWANGHVDSAPIPTGLPPDFARLDALRMPLMVEASPDPPPRPTAVVRFRLVRSRIGGFWYEEA